MKRFVVQTHIHGSGSEGSGSYAAHDHAAVQAGHVDLIWWMDHDWRVANFAKINGFDFEAHEEIHVIPNRAFQAEPPTTPIIVNWEPVEGNSPEGSFSISTDGVHAGAGAYRLELPAGVGERTYALALKAQVQHERFPLFSHPLIHLAVHTETAATDCHPFVRLTLSQQPPDLEPVSICYLVGSSGAAELTGKTLQISVAVESEGWAELTFDPAADALRYGLAGGLDNSLHTIEIGVESSGPRIVARLDSLRIEPGLKGSACLDELRKLIAGLRLALPSHIGIEVSYYGQHINAFGSGVPIPDYERIPRSEFSTRMIVDHIHAHGGLACLNHPHTGNLVSTVDKLTQCQVYDADLMEVAHGAGHLLERLALLDELAARGFTLTGIAASDAHGAQHGWGIAGRPPAWVNHIWAESLNEADLLEALSRGRVYVTDPAEFAGTLSLDGSAGITMGDVVVSAEFPTLSTYITGLQPNDMVLWLMNGRPVRVGLATNYTYYEEWQPAGPVRGVAAIRIQVCRPRLAGAAYGGLIVAGNPIYVTDAPLRTRHKVHAPA